MEFDGFITAELAGLRRFAAVLTGDRDLAHDVLVDALIVASRRWSTISVMEHPAAYVRRCVVNMFLADRRKTARRRTSSTGDTTTLDTTQPNHARQLDDRHLLDGLLRRLPRQQRTAVVLRYYLDYDTDAIAQAMSTSTSAVRSNIARALAALRVAPDIVELGKEYS